MATVRGVTNTADHDDRESLDQLRAELKGRGWSVAWRNEAARPALVVRNPVQTALHVLVSCSDGWFRWPWGAAFAPAGDAADAADQIQFVLREVRTG